MHEPSFHSPFCYSYPLVTAEGSVSGLFLTDAEVAEIINYPLSHLATHKFLFCKSSVSYYAVEWHGG